MIACKYSLETISQPSKLFCLLGGLGWPGTGRGPGGQGLPRDFPAYTQQDDVVGEEEVSCHAFQTFES